MLLSGNGIIGIRREDKNKWERRTPLSPSHVRQLLSLPSPSPIRRILVQPSSRRIYPDPEYARAGAELTEDLSEAGTILAVKEVPIPLLLPSRTYLFFSHTIKGQPQNMPLLDALLEKRVRMVDYEAITEGGVRGGQRLVAFGRYAGIAGAVDFLRGLGERLLALGHSTPFLHVGSMYSYATVERALEAVAAAGKAVLEGGLPDAITPFTVVFTGAGRVAGGAMEVWEAMPCVRWVSSPFALRDVVEKATGEDRSRYIYCARATAEHMVVKRKPGSPQASQMQPQETGGGGSAAGVVPPPPPISVSSSSSSSSSSFTFEGGASPRVAGLGASASSTSAAASAAGGGGAGGARLREGISGILTPVASAGTRGRKAGAGVAAAADTSASAETAAASALSSSISQPPAAAIPLDVEVDEAAFDKADYKRKPEDYLPIFHIKVAPYVSAIVNCMFWEAKFPRLLTNEQLCELARTNRLRLVGVEDISCDYKGSLEFLREFTTIEAPFAVYDPITDTVVKDSGAALDAFASSSSKAFFYQAVDHLPSECPRDASDHFGDCLLPLLPTIATSREADDEEEKKKTKKEGDVPSGQKLPPEVAGAIICEKGKLSPNFAYIAGLREAALRAEAGRGLRKQRTESFLTLHFVGHLFDNRVVNRALDVVEDRGLSAQILDFHVGRDRTTPSEMRIQVFAKGDGGAAGHALQRVVEDFRALCEETGVAVAVDGEEEKAEMVPLSSRAGSFSSSSSSSSSAAAVSSSAPGLPLVPSPSPAQPSPRRILLLGSGMVSGPAVEYLLRRPSNFLTIASMFVEEARALARGRPRVDVVQLDIASDPAFFTSSSSSVAGSSSAPSPLSALIMSHDIVVSLVPATMHVPIARLAIAHRRNMVTASYTSPEMAALHPDAASAGVCILMEAGLDPGIDHMAAVKMIREVKEKGGEVTSFVSVCGGLPAPEAANNPLGYKFSWSPRGALAAMRNPARYLRDGNEVSVKADDLLSSARKFAGFGPGFALEVLPNRDSLGYAGKYEIETPALRTMFRGTIRYAGFAGKMRLLAGIGLLDIAPRPLPLASSSGAASSSTPSLREVLASLLGKDAAESSDEDLARAAGEKSGVSGVDEDVLSFLQWCGLLSSSPAPLPLTSSSSSSSSFVPLDLLTSLLTSKPSMSFAPGERDMALLQHAVEVVYPSTGKRERRTMTLAEFAVEEKEEEKGGGGEQGGFKGQGKRMVTAMARTVGYTAAIGAQLILDGKNVRFASGSAASASPFSLSRVVGVVQPMAPEWHGPMLEALEGEGIRFREEVEEMT